MEAQSITAEMNRLENLAKAADHRREMLREVQIFVDEISAGGLAAATASLFEDTIDIRICLGASSPSPQADPAPQSTTTEPATPAGVNAVAEAGAGPAGAEGLVERSPAPVDGGHTEAAAPAFLRAVPPSGASDIPAAPKPVTPAPKRAKAKKVRATNFRKVWDRDKELLLARMRLDEDSWEVIADQLGVTIKACQVRWQMIKKRDYVLALEAGTAPAPVSVSASDLALDWASHLDRVGNDNRWTVEVDSRLTRYMAQEMGIGSAAALLRIKRDLVEARWKALIDVPFKFKFSDLKDALEARFSKVMTSAAAR